MRFFYSRDHLAKLILMSATKEIKLSVSTNRIDPLSLEVGNSTPCEITVQPTARLLTTDGMDIASTVVEEPWQIIAKTKSKSFSVRPNGILESGQQKVAGIRSKSMDDPDYMDAVLSVKAVVKTSIYDEIQISRDFPVRIKMTN